MLCLEKNTEEFTRLDCGHYFHTKCLMKWYDGDVKSCPMCRNETNIRWGIYDDDLEGEELERVIAKCEHEIKAFTVPFEVLFDHEQSEIYFGAEKKQFLPLT